MNDDILKSLINFNEIEMKKALSLVESSVKDINIDQINILHLSGYIPTGIFNYIKAIRCDICYQHKEKVK